MEPQRYLRCLGQPALFAATGEPIRFRTRKHLALLVYIAVEARAHRRDRLAELLWPKVSVTEARHSLATALSTLRPRLGLEGLETSRDHVRLMPGRVSLDLERLQAGDVLGTEVTGPLEVAAFLDGFDITDSAEFTHWKDRQQARLLPVIKDALLVLIDRCRRNGESRQIEQLADRMLALDDLSEEAIRAKMEARAFAGDRLTALEIFEEWKSKLAEELQAVPSDLVEGMAVRLRRRGWERSTLANIPNVPTDQWRGRPFIGRTAEYRVLYEAWEGVRKGIPGHALILGDSGVGKTTLVQRLTTAAGLEGAAISRVQCYDVEREIPYSTLSSLILGLLDRPGVSATSPEALAELARMVPEVRRRFPNIPETSESQGETARIRLTEAFHEMLMAIAEEHPVILIVDDLHRADDVSLAVLHLVMRRCGGQPTIMIVLLARSGELTGSSQATRLRDSRVALRMREVELSPLNEDESLQMLASLTRRDEASPSVSEQRALLLAAAGYPMVLELLVQDWKTSGEHSMALSVSAMTANIGSAVRAQGYYREILNRITHSLDSTTHNVLNLASILGRRLNELSLYTLVDLSMGQTISSMAELVNRRVLRDGAQGLEFVNELLRAEAYISVPQTLRHVLHSSVADLFIHKHAQGANDIALEIAWHCMRAGRTDEATRYLLRGARESMSKGAVHSAERALSTAIPHLKNPERDEARLLLVEVLQEQGRWLDSRNLLKEHPHQGSDLELILSLIADYWSTPQEPSDLVANIAKALEVINSTSDVRLQVKAAGVLALLMASLRDADTAKQLLRCVTNIPITSLDMDDLACLCESRARLLYNALEPGPCLNEIVQIAEQLRDKRYINSTVASLHSGLGAVACCQGKYVDARIEFRRAYDISARLGNDTMRGNRAAQIALCCFRLGEYDEAIEWSSRASEIFGQHFTGYIECQTAQYSGCSHALKGDHRRALDSIDRLESRISRSVPAWTRQAWLLAKADILLLVGRHSEALDVGLQALGENQAILHSNFFAGAFARWLALTSRETTREDEARAQLSSMINVLETFDAIDQVEILCARNVLNFGKRPFLDDTEGLIVKKLEYLPPAFSQLLSRLGVLSHSVGCLPSRTRFW